MDLDRWITRGAVASGLVLSLATQAVMGAPEPPLPGVALGSPALLVLERTVVALACWLALIVVGVEAWRGAAADGDIGPRRPVRRWAERSGEGGQVGPIARAGGGRSRQVPVRGRRPTRETINGR